MSNHFDTSVVADTDASENGKKTPDGHVPSGSCVSPPQEPSSEKSPEEPSPRSVHGIKVRSIKFEAPVPTDLGT